MQHLHIMKMYFRNIEFIEVGHAYLPHR